MTEKAPKKAKKRPLPWYMKKAKTKPYEDENLTPEQREHLRKKHDDLTLGWGPRTVIHANERE